MPKGKPLTQAQIVARIYGANSNAVTLALVAAKEKAAKK